jgi:hypothetical protein
MDSRPKVGQYSFFSPLLISLFLLPLSQVRAGCARIFEQTLSIYLYNQSAASEQELSDLEKTVNEVFSHTRFTVFWVQSLSEGGSAIKRVEQSANEDISVTIVDSWTPVNCHVMGAATLGTGRATVYYRRAQVLARMAEYRVSTGKILGYVASHEIAHLILHSSDHSAKGVLKRAWSRDEFRDMSQSQFWFTGEFPPLSRDQWQNEALPARGLEQAKAKCRTHSDHNRRRSIDEKRHIRGPKSV